MLLFTTKISVSQSDPILAFYNIPEKNFYIINFREHISIRSIDFNILNLVFYSLAHIIMHYAKITCRSIDRTIFLGNAINVHCERNMRIRSIIRHNCCTTFLAFFCYASEVGTGCNGKLDFVQ